ncbi:MAG: HAD-IA family hydrolase [Prevotella sp.]|nr:HAD-IA family hydrolase [Prevotella sp.]MCM1075323.1 HAD-IA family hydrolase [Ruminococcus sp.]
MDIVSSISSYCKRHDIECWHPVAALIDMDGVLYDSMPGHASAWKKMMDEQGIPCSEDEFFLYEGMTGKATIEMLMQERLGRNPKPGEVEKLYALKSEYFRQQGPRQQMPGASKMLDELRKAGLKRVLVTGSAQNSLLESLAHDYPGAFHPHMRVTALDVTKGKPDSEPYLKGLEKAESVAAQTIVIENAPLGVQAGHAAGCFTIGITTGPVPEAALLDAGADIVFSSMPEFGDHVSELVAPRKL